MEELLLDKLSKIDLTEIYIYKITSYQNESVTFYEVKFTPSYEGMGVVHEFGSVVYGEVQPLGDAWVCEGDIVTLSLDSSLGKVEKQEKCETVLSWGQIEQILEVNAAHKAAVFLGNSIFVKIGCTLADEPLQFIIQRIRTGLHSIECRCIVEQCALFCGQSVAVRQMVCNDFLDRFRCSFRVDFADSGHNKTLPFTFLFDELPVSYTHLHTMSIGILLFAAIFQQKVI